MTQDNSSSSEQPVVPVSLTLSPQMIEFIEYLERSKKEFDEYVLKCCGITEEQSGATPQSRTARGNII